MTAPTLVSTTTPQTGAAQTMAVNMPASVAAGDLIIVWMAHGGTIGAMPGSPNAFTVKTTADAQQTMAYLRGADHIANGSPASYTFTTSIASIISRGMASRISGAIGSGDPFDVASVVGTTTASTSSASLTITTVTADTLLLNYDTKSGSATNTSVPTGLTLQTPATNAAHQFTGPLASAGSSGAKQSGYSAATNHRNVLAAIKPATTQNVSVTGFAPAVAFGTVTLIQDQFVPVTGFAPAVAFGTASLLRTLAPTGFTPTVVFGAPSLVQDQFVTPTGFTVSVDFGTPSLGQFLNVDGFGVPVLFGTPAVLLDNVLTVTGFTPTIVFGAAGVERQPFVTATVYDHETDNPLGAGATVQLFDENGTLLDTTTTDANGDYIFYLPFGFTDNVFTVVRTTIGLTDYQGVSEICAVST